jgi:hypothetical protein
MGIESGDLEQFIGEKFARFLENHNGPNAYSKEVQDKDLLFKAMQSAALPGMLQPGASRHQWRQQMGVNVSMVESRYLKKPEDDVSDLFMA